MSILPMERNAGFGVFRGSLHFIELGIVIVLFFILSETVFFIAESSRKNLTLKEFDPN
jgi:hypothetical protein